MHRTKMSLQAGLGRVSAEGAASLWRHENKPENMCQGCTSHHSGHIVSHTGTHLGENTLFSFVSILIQFLNFLNNSALAKIARSYSVLNMPERATDKGARGTVSISPFVTHNRQTNSFCYNARRIVSHQFCT